MIAETNNAAETFALAEQIGENARPGLILTLNGDLGAGKTVFAQGVAKGLGVEGPVNSPTFTILKEYTAGRLPLYHFDLYRIEEPEEMDEIGYEDCFFGKGVCLIEWADRIRELIPEEAVDVYIEKDPLRGPDYRRIRIEGQSDENTGD